MRPQRFGDLCVGKEIVFLFYKVITFLKGLGYLVLCNTGGCCFLVIAFLFKILNSSFWSQCIRFI